MNFLITLFNHNTIGRTSLEDPVSIIGHQLQALKHGVDYLPENEGFLPGHLGINIVFEGFVPYSTAVIEEAYNRGCRFLCVATEEPTAKGFNHGLDKEMRARQEEFKNTAKYFEGIFHLVPGNHVRDWFAQFAPTSYVELGYATTLLRPTDWGEPTHDFGFFGSLSPRRHKILKRLSNYTGKPVRVVASFASQLERDRIMREAKVILQIRKEERMGLVSSSRCNTALHLGRPVLAEPHDLCEPWNQVIKFSQDLDCFLRDALLMRTAWKGVHAAQMEKFREKFSAEYCIGRALKEINLNMETRAVA